MSRQNPQLWKVEARPRGPVRPGAREPPHHLRSTTPLCPPPPWFNSTFPVKTEKPEVPKAVVEVTSLRVGLEDNTVPGVGAARGNSVVASTWWARA